MIAVVAVVATAAAVASYVVRPNRARAFDLYYGTTVLNDNNAPVVVDLASGKPTISLTDAWARVGAAHSDELKVVPLQGGALLLDTVTGEFNMLDSTGFVVKTTNGGVQLPALPGSTGAQGIADAGDAYIVQAAPDQTRVYLVSQATVAAAASAAATPNTPTPRAHASIADPVGSQPGSAVAANGDLWLLTGTSTHTIRRLHVPSGSDAGVQLSETDYGSVPGVSALAVTSTTSNGSGQDDVAVASPTSLRIFGAGSTRTVSVAAPPGTTQILPAGNQEATGATSAGSSAGFDFLYHSPSGWTLVSATTDGTVAVHPIPEIPAGAQLAVPARSEGAVYTMTTTSPGDLWHIDPAGHATPVPGMATYPVLPREALQLSTATVTAYGSRVIFNSRFNLEAATVFADGSKPPVTINKATAVAINSSGGIDALAAQHNNGPAQKPNATPPTTTPKPAEQVNDKIDCKTATQLPHVPLVQLVQRGSRSVQLTWQYPLLSPQDCLPSTYTVTATRIGSGPAAPGTVTVQGQNGVNLGGLFPDTKYSIVVTAYINSIGTPSQPLDVETGPEGPPAPTNVHTTTDAHGDWVVSWNSCGGLTASCVPTSEWRIVPSFCDGLGLSSPPAGATIAGDPTLHSFSYVLPGGGAMLGRGLTVQVEGIGPTGLPGAFTSDNSCTYSWTSPDAAAIHVTASSPPDTSTQGTSSTTVSVTFDGDKNVALGGIGGQLSYALLDNGNEVDSRGPTDATTVTFGGLHPGHSYAVQVTAIPPNHPEAAVNLAPVAVQPAVSDWPTLALSPAPAFTRSDPNGLDRYGSLAVSIAGLSSAEAGGETFDLVNSALTCGNTSLPLDKSNFDPSAGALTFDKIDRTVYNGNCQVNIQLTQDSATETSPAYFGASNSAMVTANVNVPVPSLNIGAGDFTAKWAGAPGASAVSVTYDNTNPTVTSFGTNWSMTVTNGATANCGEKDNDSPPTQIPVSGDCIQQGGTFTVAVSFTYFGTQEKYTVPVDAQGAPQPLDLQPSDFNASWASDGSQNIDLSLAQSVNVGDGSNWSEVVDDGAAGDLNCGSGSFTPTTTPQAISISDACVLAGQATTWTVTVTYTDVNTGAVKHVAVTVSGTPPAPAPTTSPSPTDTGSSS